MLASAHLPCLSQTQSCLPVHRTTCHSLPATHSVSYCWAFACAVPSTWSTYPLPLPSCKTLLHASGLGSDIAFPGRFPASPMGTLLPHHSTCCFGVASMHFCPLTGLGAPPRTEMAVPSTQQKAQPRGGTQRVLVSEYMYFQIR